MIKDILSCQLGENLIQIAILFITAIALIVAIRTYISDVNQKRLKNTLEYIHLFLEGNWISKQDKILWNKFFRQMLCRNACGDFALTGKFKISQVKKNSIEEINVNEIFMEGNFQEYGVAITNILNIMEYIAQKALCGDLDIDIIRIQLLRFYQLADFYIGILGKDNIIEYSKCKKLYSTFRKCFNIDKPYGNYCEFPI